MLTSFCFSRRYDSVINRLYTGIQCYSCGMRFTTSQTDVYADHLDWHYRQNRSEKDVSRKITHRRWYYSVTVSNAISVPLKGWVWCFTCMLWGWSCIIIGVWWSVMSDYSSSFYTYLPKQKAVLWWTVSSLELSVLLWLDWEWNESWRIKAFHRTVSVLVN